MITRARLARWLAGAPVPAARGRLPLAAALARAEVQAAAAGDSFRSGEALLEGDVLIRLAAELPWIGEQVATARDLAALGYEGSRAGVAAASALRPPDGRAAGGAR